MVVDVQTVSIAIASAGVFLAAIYYIFQLRHQSKMRQTDLVIRLSADMKSREMLQALIDVMVGEFKDYGDFVQKYGMPFSKNEVPMSFLMIGNFFEQLGVLFRNRLIDASLIVQLFPIFIAWQKMKPLVEGIRKEYHSFKYYEWFEYLYSEMKKREQKPQSQA